MNKQYFVSKIWDTIHYITVLYWNATVHYTYCIGPTLNGTIKGESAHVASFPIIVSKYVAFISSFV